MKKHSTARASGVRTLAKRMGITKKEAQRRQAVAIALRAAGKPLSKRKKLKLTLKCLFVIIKS